VFIQYCLKILRLKEQYQEIDHALSDMTHSSKPCLEPELVLKFLFGSRDLEQ